MKLSHRSYRPNTRKMYEEAWQVCVLPGFEVHHVLPERLGGQHEVSNLALVSRDEHVQAHLDLWVEHGDPRDLCAAFMISGRDRDAHLVACAMGGRASQIAKRRRKDKNGFQIFDAAKRREIAAKAGRKGGLTQMLKRLGIHTDDAVQRSAWARLGAEAVKETFATSEAQARRGRRGGVKNKGARWYRDETGSPQKYTRAMQEIEPFEAFLRRTGFQAGKGSSVSKGARFYNDGASQWMFDPNKHDLSFEEFILTNGFNKGRLR